MAKVLPDVYKRQVHLGPAASQMEKRGIRTDKGEVNRQIVADNKLLKEIKARITRLYRWSKAEAEKPQTQQSSLTALWAVSYTHLFLRTARFPFPLEFACLRDFISFLLLDISNNSTAQRTMRCV